jgi:hypothetical protein
MFYNTAPFPRTVCDEHVEPDHQAVDLPRSVTDPHRLRKILRPFRQACRPLSFNRNWHDSTPNRCVERSSRLQTLDKCDICKYEINMLVKRYIAGTEWKIVQTADDPYFLDANKIERTAFRRHLLFHGQFAIVRAVIVVQF